MAHNAVHNTPTNGHSNGNDSEIMKLEIRRQTFHLVMGLLVVAGVYYNILDSVKIFVLLIAGIVLSLLCKKYELPIIYPLMRFFGRDEEIRKFPGKGAIFFFVGVLLAIKLFPKDVALAAIMILALGDSIGHIVGRKFGKTKSPFTSGDKLLEGTIIGFAVGFLGAMIFVSPWEALLAALFAMIAESIEFDLNKAPVDDNIIVPLVAGTVVYLMRLYL